MELNPSSRSNGRYLLGIDPGLVFTGLAILDKQDGSPVWTATIQNRLKDVTGWPWRDLLGWFTIYEVWVAVSESPSPFGNAEMQRVAHSLDVTLKCLGFASHWVSPGVWKPVERAHQWAKASGWGFATTHERDAYGIARYWLWKESNGQKE